MDEVYKIQRRHKRVPSVNMAPLVDMIFLLLIFFMVTTSFVQQTGIEVRKPKAVSSRLLPRRNIIITVSRDGEIYLEGEKFPRKEFRDRLKAKIESSPDSTVIIATDLDTKMLPVVEAMDEAVKHGAQRLSIATEYKRWEE